MMFFILEIIIALFLLCLLIMSLIIYSELIAEKDPNEKELKRLELEFKKFIKKDLDQLKAEKDFQDFSG